MRDKPNETTLYSYRTYRDGADLVTEMDNITLLHLDNPSHEIIKRRIEEAIREEDTCFDKNCYLCKSMMGRPYTLVYTSDGEELG